MPCAGYGGRRSGNPQYGRVGRIFLGGAGGGGGQPLVGGTASGDDLTLRATSHATVGDIVFQSNGTPTETMRIFSTGSVAIGTTASVGILDVEGNNAIVVHSDNTTQPGSV